MGTPTRSWTLLSTQRVADCAPPAQTVSGSYYLVSVFRHLTVRTVGSARVYNSMTGACQAVLTGMLISSHIIAPSNLLDHIFPCHGCVIVLLYCQVMRVRYRRQHSIHRVRVCSQHRPIKQVHYSFIRLSLMISHDISLSLPP